jgi:hypothetical protein
MALMKGLRLGHGISALQELYNFETEEDSYLKEAYIIY